MSAPKKPLQPADAAALPTVKAPRKRRTTATTAAGIAVIHTDDKPALSPDEQKLLAVYRRMARQQRTEVMAIAVALAKAFPLHVGPSLRLIVGGAL